MTTSTIEKGLVSLQAVGSLVKEMNTKGVKHIYPKKISNRKLRNEAIDEIIIDEDGNVFLLPTNSNEVILPQFANLF